MAKERKDYSSEETQHIAQAKKKARWEENDSWILFLTPR